MHRAMLRVGCHNVNGLAAKLPMLTEYWRQLSLDVVVAIDTHVDFFARPAVQRSLSADGWASYWCIGLPSTGHGRAKAGVAVLVRSQLLLSGVVSVEGGSTAPAAGPAQGRLLQVPLCWAGQRFDVLGLYLHANDAVANAAIISGPLRDMQRAAHPNHFLLGDFNFVEDCQLDRRRVGVAPGVRQQHDATPAAAWGHHLGTVHDVWRMLHPHRRGFTYVRSDAASRLDRIYCASTMLRQVISCSIDDRLPAVSDHWPVHMQLVPASPGALGPGLPRLRLAMQSDDTCRQVLRDWLVSQQPPADPAAVLDTWWPHFKLALQQQVGILNRLAKQRRAGLSEAAQLATATAALTAARTRLEVCSDNDVSGALNDVVLTAARLAELRDAAELVQRERRRQQWIHTGERPSHVMSRQLKPPRAGTYIHALRAPGSGHFVVDGLGKASIIGATYAAVTAAPSIQQAARSAVLGAVCTHSGRLSEEAASSIGASVVTSAEVLTAIGQTAPGKAPGLDGIPGELYRQYKQQLAPLLAALYSAIGALHRAPSGFLDGVILPILKPGGRSQDPTAYRPIQLLCYDYRILAKVLSNRLLPVMGSVISDTQCAFLPYRQIKHSIRLLQLLPVLLHALGQAALAVFTDFRKAYDTVDRGFLSAIADCLGFGVGFGEWLKVLLTNTYSCAVVNGFKSAFFRCEAGVRQGCPLSPLLYLLVGQALLCWLQQCGFGVVVAGCRMCAAQYADDAEPFLKALAELPAFLDCMRQFAAASGQHLNPSKTRVLLLGRQPTAASAQQPPPAADVPVAESAKSLGVTFTGVGNVQVDWEARLAVVKQRLTKISNIPNLSAFGRAFAVNAYALGTLLYVSQFACSIPTQHAALLQKWCAAVVDAALSPEGSLQRPPGIPTSCMAAHPRSGGFGMLPLQQHMLARWGCEARDLIISSQHAAPWVQVGRALWRQWSMQQRDVGVQAAGDSIWGLCLCPRQLLFRDPERPSALLPQPLRAFAQGLRALPPMQHVGEHAWDIDALCWTAPLWSNPVFTITQSWDWHGGQRDVSIGLEHAAPPTLLCLPMLQSLGQLVTLECELDRVCASSSLAAHAAYRAAIFPVYLQCRPQYADKQTALAEVRALLGLLPAQWVAAARRRFLTARTAGTHITSLMTVAQRDLEATRDSVAAYLGWHVTTPNSSHQADIPFSQLKVASATRLQHSPTLADIHTRHTAFVTSIATLEGVLPHVHHMPGVCSVLTRWWQLHVANSYKESAWRLTLNAFPTAQRMHVATLCPACGEQSPGVEHLFWTCPVASVVRLEVERQLVATGILPTPSRLPCSTIWLARLPDPRIHQLVWDLVCLAAVHAMNIARKTAWAVSQRLPTQSLIERIAARAAVGAFWDALADFAATLKTPRTAQNALLTQQPFLAWHVVLRCGSGLRVVRQ